MTNGEIEQIGCSYGSYDRFKKKTGRKTSVGLRNISAYKVYTGMVSSEIAGNFVGSCDR
jgi:hypothetical protein